LTLKVSFKEIGTPCRGPTVLPVLSYALSRNFARSMASSKKISVKQLHTCCAMAARLQKAIVTCSAVTLRDLIASAIAVASYFSVMDSSAGVRIPLVRGIDRTSRTSGGGGEERSHALGIRDCLSACLRRAIATQGASEAILT